MALGYLVSPVIQLENKDGKPLTGGHVTVYRHGTTIPYITYKDFNGDRNPASVPLNNIGSCILIADDAFAYDIYVTDRNDVEVLSRLGVTVNGGVGGTGVLDITSSDGSITITHDGGDYDIKMTNATPTVWVSSDNPAVYQQYLNEDGNFVLAEGSKHGDGLELVDGVLTVRETGWYHLSVNWHVVKGGGFRNEYREVKLLVNGEETGANIDMSKTRDPEYGAWNGDLEFDEDDVIVFSTDGLESDQKTAAYLDKVSVHKLTGIVGGSGSGGVPDITAGDDKKILQANYSGGAGSATWEDPAKVIARVLGYNYYGDAPADGVIRVHTSNLPNYGAGSVSAQYVRQVLGGPDIYYYDIYQRPQNTSYDIPIPPNTLEVVASGRINPECATWLFNNCPSLTTISPIVFDGQVTVCAGMFYGCSSLPSDQIFEFDTSNVESMRSMFSLCRALTTLPDLDYSSVTDVSYMFYGCTNMTESCLPLYQQLSANPNITSHEGCFYQYGINTPAIAGDLDLIPQSWGGNAEG